MSFSIRKIGMLKMPKIAMLSTHRCKRVTVLVDIDTNVDYCIHSDLHLHAVAAYGLSCSYSQYAR
jgi:hypothetical protein